jgi:hypothetical protein
MTEITKDRFTRIIQTVVAMLGGAVLTLVFNVARDTQSNTSDIAVLKAQVEPLVNVAARIAALETMATRNYDMLTRIETQIATHMLSDKK